jgi:hypothetical protein
MARSVFSVQHHGGGHEVTHVFIRRLECPKELLKPAHAEIGFVDHHEFHSVASGQVGHALQAELALELTQKELLAFFGNVQLTDALDGGVSVMEADDMEVFRLHGEAKVVQADELTVDLGFIGSGCGCRA